MTRMLTSILIASDQFADEVYGADNLNALRLHSRFVEPFLAPGDLSLHRDALERTEVIFTTWGAPVMDAAFLDLCPNLRAVFYGAGSVRPIVTDEVWKRGITVCSAWKVNAIPVAEFSLGAILLSLKQVWAYHRQSREAKIRRIHLETLGSYRSTVGLVGLGAIGRRVVDLLRPFDVNILVHDPHAGSDEASHAGIEFASLHGIFKQSDVVSIHVPLLKETERLIGGGLIRSMKPHASLINTARGAVVDEEALSQALQDRSDLTAILDVTTHEPPDENSPLYRLPNVLLTPHIAGSIGKECRRMGAAMVEEFLRFSGGEVLQHQITQTSLAKMA